MILEKDNRTIICHFVESNGVGASDWKTCALLICTRKPLTIKDLAD
jgi:hypothetical protein